MFRCRSVHAWPACLWTHIRAHYDMGLSDMTTRENWQINSFLFQIDVLMML